MTFLSCLKQAGRSAIFHAVVLPNKFEAGLHVAPLGEGRGSNRCGMSEASYAILPWGSNTSHSLVHESLCKTIEH